MAVMMFIKECDPSTHALHGVRNSNYDRYHSACQSKFKFFSPLEVDFAVRVIYN
jgi:hypothetical protein